MWRTNFSNFRRIALAICALSAVMGLCATSQAAFLTTDGDFGLQTVGNPPASPWNNPTNGQSISSAQSPYTNVFSQNDKSANGVSTNSNSTYFVQQFTAIPANATGNLYLNVDFQNTSAGDGGGYSIVVTSDADGSKIAAGLAITGNQLFAKTTGGVTGDNGTAVMSLDVGQWYNVQLTLNLDTDTYSGTVSTLSGSTAISSRAFVTNNQISGIYSDYGTAGIGGFDPAHNIDNFVLSTTPFAPIPEPGSLTLLALGGLGLAIARRRRRRA